MSSTWFWLVWNPSGNNPTHRHATLDSAVQEADRLARYNRGQQFIVLQSVCASVVNEIQHTDLRPNPADDLPF